MGEKENTAIEGIIALKIEKFEKIIKNWFWKNFSRKYELSKTVLIWRK